jgi:glycosyltransferase involved in cell wall biosynthesis
MRLLFVAHRYLPQLGGTEIHTFEVARRLSASGHEVTVLATDLHGGLPERERRDGVEIIRVRAWPTWTDAYVAPRVASAVREIRPDIVHCQGYHTLVAPLAMATALAAHLPYVVTFHSGGHSGRARKPLRWLQNRVVFPLLVRADRLVAVSPFEAGRFAGLLDLEPSRIAVIPNGADIEVSDAERASPEPDLILSMGRLERYKGHHRVISAFPLVLRERPNARLVLTGSGPYGSELKRLATEAGCADRVEIRAIPVERRDDFVRLVGSAALVTVLSEYESQGMGAMEAASLERPLLVSDTTALHELVTAGVARGVAPEAGPEAVAEAMLVQLRAPLRPNGVHLPTWDDCAASLLELYGAILAERARTRG